MEHFSSKKWSAYGDIGTHLRGSFYSSVWVDSLRTSRRSIYLGMAFIAVGGNEWGIYEPLKDDNHLLETMILNNIIDSIL